MRLSKHLLVWGPSILGLAASAVLVHGSEALRKPTFIEMARELGIEVDNNGLCLESRQSLTPQEAELVDVKDADLLGPKWGCVMFSQNLNRERGVAGHDFPSQVLALTRAKAAQGLVTVNGAIKYMGIKSGGFHYDVEKDPLNSKQVLITVRINFGGIYPDQKTDMQDKLDKAAQFWSDNSPERALRFSFKAVEDTENPHFYVGFGRGKKRTPYYQTWWSDWDSDLISHEIGHMLGLDDEYNQLRVTFSSRRANPVYTSQCQFGSIMCTYAWWAKPQKYHYYLILNRVNNQFASQTDEDFE